MERLPALVLASASPRRRELLAMLGLPFEVVPSAADETLPAGVPVEQAVVLLAEVKAHAVARLHPGATVLGADTLVIQDGRVLGKPADAKQARLMLERLRGRRHIVVTGVCLRSDSLRLRRLVSTQVRMRACTDAEIAASIAAGTPFDKAGAYAIQDAALAPVAEIEGCYCNVMGLPLWTLYAMLLDAGVYPAPQPPDRVRPICAACPLQHRAGLGSVRRGVP